MHSIFINKQKYLLPTEWEELTEAQAVEVFKACLLTSEEKALSILKAVTPGIVPYIPNMELDDLDEVLAIATAFITKPLLTPIIKQITHEGVTYMLPTEKLYSCVGIQYYSADTALSNKELIKLAACLLTPVGTKWHHDKIDEQISLFQTLPAWAVFYISLLFIGCKADIAETYPEVFTSTNTSNEEGESEGFGWLGTFFTLADNGAFGIYNQVCYTYIHEILFYLVIKKDQAEKAQAEADKQRLKQGR